MHRDLRLRESYEVQETRARGKAFAAGPLVARVLLRPSSEVTQNRYAIVAGKKVGNAVARNRCKRLVREGLRSLHPQLQQGYDIVVIVRGTPEEMPSLAVAMESLQSICRRAQLLSDVTPAGVTTA